MDTDYSGTPIIKNQWPKWVDLGNGHWERRWRFRFEIDIVDIPSSEQFDYPRTMVSLAEGADPRELLTTVRTQGNPFSDDLFFIHSYVLFQQLEHMIGKLSTIQGQPRELWRPFR